MPTDTRGPLTERVASRRFQRYLGLIVSAFGLLYSLQTLDALVADWPSMAGPLGAAVIALVTCSVLLGTVAGLISFHSRRLFLGAAILYVAAVATWPFSITGTVPATPMPWFIGLLPVEAAYFAIAVRRPGAPIACVMLLAAAVAAVLGLRGGLAPADAAANALFGNAISVALVILIAGVRRSVKRADDAQQAALASYGRSRLDDSTERERTRTDALVHDSVLTTLLAAAAAREPETEDLARRMAQNSLRVLAHVTRSVQAGPGITFGRALGDAVDRFDPLLSGWEVVDDGLLSNLVLPVDTAEAIVESMLRAITAGVLHADGATSRSIRMTELGPDGLRIVVADDGRACDPDDADDERNDLHHAAVELMRGVDGRADVRSTQAEGTVVTLSWGSVVVSGTAPLPERAEVLG